MCMAKSDCMLAIVWLLKSRGRITAKELADILEISVRSVYRYIDSLCASGVPIDAESGHEGGYSLPPSYVDVPLFFTTEEKTALAHSALFAKKGGYPFTTALTAALRKIEYYSTQDQLTELSMHLSGLHVVSTADHSSYKRILGNLEQAIADGQTVIITYCKPKEYTHVARNIDPYSLIHWRDRWYVIAYYHLRNEIRTFRVDRISDYKQTSITFTRPEWFSANEFFAAHQMTTTTGTSKLKRVLLTGHLDAIDDLSKHWFMGQRSVSQLSYQALYLIEEEAMVSYVPHILLSFGKSIRIVEPESLKLRMTNLALELSEYYQHIH
jgi:predicted DNA-binding transcriptional regulator YafY